MNQLEFQRRTMALIGILWLAACAGTSVPVGGGAATQTDTAVDVGVDLGIPPVDTLPTDLTAPPELPPADSVDTAPTAPETSSPIAWTPFSATAGSNARGVTLSTGRIAWEEDGVIQVHDLATKMTWTAVGKSEPGAHREPVLDSDRLVFTNDRTGDRDLWVLDLATKTLKALVVAPGDQLAPSLDHGLLAWIDRRSGAHDALASELWSMDLDVAGAAARQLTSDAVEQAWPHVRGRRVVFTDFSKDVDKKLTGLPESPIDHNSDNGDILGLDVPIDAASAVPKAFVITDDPNKQARPAVDGDAVAWLDWRGITPEPKYARFKIYARVGAQAEQLLGETGWNTAELWRRPAIQGSRVAWVMEATAAGLSGPHAVYVGNLTTQKPAKAVPETSGLLLAVDLREDALAWAGPGHVGLLPLTAVPSE